MGGDDDPDLWMDVLGTVAAFAVVYLLYRLIPAIRMLRHAQEVFSS